MGSTATRRDRLKIETRRIIIENACALFESEGFEKTTIRAVANRAGIGLGTIYKHFTNKKDLLAAALLEDLQQLFQTAGNAVAAEAPLKSRFLSLSGHFYTYYASSPALIREYLTNFFLMEDRGLQPINEFDEVYLEMVIELVRTGQENGEVDPDRDAGLVAQSLMAVYFFVLVNYFIRYRVTDVEKLTAILAGLIDQVLT